MKTQFNNDSLVSLQCPSLIFVHIKQCLQSIDSRINASYANLNAHLIYKQINE